MKEHVHENQIDRHDVRLRVRKREPNAFLHAVGISVLAVGIALKAEMRSQFRYARKPPDVIQ
jgi:hypothetical protein